MNEIDKQVLNILQDELFKLSSEAIRISEKQLDIADYLGGLMMGCYEDDVDIALLKKRLEVKI